MSNINNENISKFIDGNLSDEERKITSEEIKEYNNKNKMNNPKEFNADKAWNTFSERINKSENSNRNFVLSRSFKFAASIILIVGLSLLTLYILNSNHTVEFASADEIVEYKLPDGTVVTLNNQSSISYNKNFKGDTRTVEFEGEAFFDVVKNPNKPFVIKANGAEIEVLGTAFNLKSDKGIAEVIVTEGKVKFSDVSDNESVILMVGDRGTIVDGKVSSSINKDHNFLSWKTKILFFKQGELLKDVASDLEDFYNVSIIFEDDSIGLLPVSENEFKDHKVTFILNLYSTLHNLEYSFDNGVVIFSKVNN